MTIIEEARKTIHATCNHNFHYGSLEWVTKVWLHEICCVLDKRLAEIDKKLKE